MTTERTYAYGFRTREQALESLDYEVSWGRLTAADCRVASYRNKAGGLRWQILEKE